MRKAPILYNKISYSTYYIDFFLLLNEEHSPFSRTTLCEVQRHSSFNSETNEQQFLSRVMRAPLFISRDPARQK